MDSLLSKHVSKYEYRVFCTSLGHSADLRTAFNTLRTEGDVTEEIVTTDIYFLSAEPEIDSIKLRDGRLEGKRLQDRHDDLEQWSPTIFVSLPVAADVLREHLFPALKLIQPSMLLGVPPVRDGDFTAHQLLDELVWPSPGLFAARVEKRRRYFSYAGIVAEMDEAVINGATLLSLAIEAPQADLVQHARAQLQLSDRPNTNYVDTLQYTLGLRKPPATENQIGVYV
jgi:hypothetical protein